LPHCRPDRLETCETAGRGRCSRDAIPPRERRPGYPRDEIERRVRDLIEHLADEIRSDRAGHDRRLGQFLPSLADEFGETKTGEEIRACADAILNDYDDVPVRSFVLTLAERRIRDCLREPECRARRSAFDRRTI
jgi:hypothetical protein